ncbi:MAG: protein kinase [Deltaproteobacteria bacterium]|nr:protein kinase [Deltaproteobacteria bacterium]
MRSCPTCLAVTDGATCPADGTPTREDPLLGTVLDGRFEIVAPLGHGGMGTVYRAVERSLDRAVAVKVLRPTLVLDASSQARFMREVRVLAALRHPGIVVLHHWGQGPQGPYMVTELLEGETLAVRLQRHGALTVTAACRITGHVARALGQAHHRGVVHRDLKPDNIFLDRMEDGQEAVKVLDFGIAKFFQKPRRSSDGGWDSFSTATHDLVGTPAYFSPEQVREEELDGRSDLFTLGTILFQCVAGRLPFAGADGPTTLLALLEKEPAPLPPGLPDELVHLVRWLLQKDPARRPAHAAEVAPLLEDLALRSRERVERTLVMAPAPAWDGPTLAEGGGAPGRARAGLLVGVALASGLVASVGTWAAGTRTAPPQPEPTVPAVPAAVDAPSPPPPEPAAPAGQPHAEPGEPPVVADPALPERPRRPVRATPKATNPEALRREIAARLVREASRQLLEGQFEAAEGRARGALEMHPQNVEAHRLLGVVLTRLGRHCDAKAYYRQLLALEPGTAQAGRVEEILKDASFSRCP